MSALASRRPLQAGTVIDGKYRVGAELGHGGMATVYDAVHIELERPVALKVLRHDLARNETFALRFSREARAAAKLQSQHAAAVTDVGSFEGPTGELPYIVMERLRGHDLHAHLVENGPLEVEQAVDWLLQACVAVAEAHARGLVHRDLKPSNLFLAVRDDGMREIKVLDFGIAKAFVGDDAVSRVVSLTRTNDVFGSPHYMSPEQLRASGDVDARSDVWALGVVIYELLSCKMPFDGGTVAELHAAVLERDPIPLAARRPGLPEALCDAVMQCLHKPLDRRFADVALLAAALAPFGSTGAARSLEAIQRWAGANEARRVTAPVTTARHEDFTDATAVDRPGAPSPLTPAQQTTTSWDSGAVVPKTRASWTYAVLAMALVGVAAAGWHWTSPVDPASAGHGAMAIEVAVDVTSDPVAESAPVAPAALVSASASASAAPVQPAPPPAIRRGPPAPPPPPTTRPRSVYDDRD